MALSVAMGTKSLIQLGMSVTDIATLISLGRSKGNWMTSGSGDKEFLRAVEVDENSIQLRRGILDLDGFNKRWRQNCRLLINGHPQKIEGTYLSKTLERFSRFTAIMVSLVTVLDAFLSSASVRMVMEDVLKELLRATEIGEDLMRAEFANRLQAWRSAGAMRGMTTYVRKCRLDLVKGAHVFTSYPPMDETRNISELLIWLLLGNDRELLTPSSDVAGVAFCLSHVVFDLLEVRGLVPWNQSGRSPYVVIHDRSHAILPRACEKLLRPRIQEMIAKRIDSMTVPLHRSEEAV